MVDVLNGKKAKCPDGSFIEARVYRLKSELSVVSRKQKQREKQGLAHVGRATGDSAGVARSCPS